MRPAALAPLALLAVVFATPRAQADDAEITTAVAEFDAAEKALLATAPCETMCKALQSMSRAADRICELARDGSATDQKRCTDAKAKVAEATARVRVSCPNCDPSPPYAPSTTPTPKVPEEKPGPDKAPAPTPPPSLAKEDVYEYSGVAGIARRATATLSLDVIPLFAPPWVIQPRFERSVSRRFSFAIRGAFGSLPKFGPEGKGRTGVFGVGGELRGYVFGSFDRFGVFVAADVMYRSGNNLSFGEYLDARGFPVGVTAGALVGTKLVIGGGLTLEARIGPSFVLRDERIAGPRDKVIPAGAISLGWTF